MNERLSRVERYKQEKMNSTRRPEQSTVRTVPQSIPALEEVDVHNLPTRKELYPSQRLKLTKWFYNSLLYLFVIVMLVLLWWGLIESPWGRSQGL